MAGWGQGSTLATALAALLALSANADAQAGPTHCEVDVYKAYTIAARRGWLFACDNATFVADAATRAIGCQGRAAPAADGEARSIQGRFFVHAFGARPALFNGWSVAGFEIAGGDWTAPTDDRRARVQFRAEIAPSQESSARRVQVLRLSKPDGDCLRVYDEAL